MSVLYEVCVEDVEGAIAAELGGADRVELCTALADGGTTPSRGAMAGARASVALPVVALIRPRPGDFVYSRVERDVIRDDVRAARDAGLAGVALGALDERGTPDLAFTAELVELARPMFTTFHRAFDLVTDPLDALDGLIASGVARVLTSGGAPSAERGVETLRGLVAAAGERITILVAGGVRAENVAALVARTGAREVHGSALGDAAEASSASGAGVPLGAGATSQPWRRTDVERVRAVVRELARPSATR